MVNSNKRPNILFVEDDVSLQKSISYILEEEGFDVICTKTGEEAIELAKEKIPDLILLGLVLPGIDGFRVCEILKKDIQTEKIFIVMLTGKGMVEEIPEDEMVEAELDLMEPSDEFDLEAELDMIGVKEKPKKKKKAKKVPAKTELDFADEELELDLELELTDLPGVGQKTADKLIEAGCLSIDDLVNANLEELSQETGISVTKLQKCVEEAKKIL